MGLLSARDAQNVSRSPSSTANDLNVMKNFMQLECLINSFPNKPHVIFINETFLRKNEEGFCNLDGYTFESNCRQVHKCGGVPAYIKNEINFSIRYDLTVMDEKIFESLI